MANPPALSAVLSMGRASLISWLTTAPLSGVTLGASLGDSSPTRSLRPSSEFPSRTPVLHLAPPLIGTEKELSQDQDAPEKGCGAKGIFIQLAVEYYRDEEPTPPSLCTCLDLGVTEIESRPFLGQRFLGAELSRGQRNMEGVGRFQETLARVGNERRGRKRPKTRAKSPFVPSGG